MAKKKPKPPEWYAGPKQLLIKPLGSFPASDYTFDPGSVVRDHDGVLVAGMNSKTAIQEAAGFLNPVQLSQFSDWARHNPVMDPRTWLSAASAGIPTRSDPGVKLTLADGARQVDEGSYQFMVGSPQKPAPPHPRNALKTRGGHGFDLGSFASDIGTGVFGFVGGVAKNTEEFVVGNAQRGVRTATTAIGSLFQAGTGTARIAAAENNMARQIARTHDLSEAETWEAFPELRPGGKQGVARGFDRLPQGLSSIDKNKVALARREFEDSAEHKRATDPGSTLRTIAEQTSGYQALAHPKEFWTNEKPGKLEEGAKFLGSEKAAKAANLVSPWFASGKIEQRQAAAVLKTYNMRTPEERKRYDQLQAQAAAADNAYDQRRLLTAAQRYAPLAWTPGRGLASVWMDPDTTGFQVMSGMVDFSNSALLDPANLLPAGAAAKGVRATTGGMEKALRAANLQRAANRVPGSATRAVMAGQERVVLHTIGTPVITRIKGAKPGTTRFAAGMEAAPGVRAGAQAPDVVEAALAGGARRVRDPDLGDVDFDPNTGIGTTPSKAIVVGQNAWNWLNSGRGARVVTSLAKETSAFEIMKATGGKFDADLATTLADTTDEAAIRAILASRMGNQIGSASDFGIMGKRAISPMVLKTNAIRNTSVGSAFEVGPKVGGFDLEDGDAVFSNVLQWGRAMRMTPDQLKPHVDNLLRARTGPERYQYLVGEFGLMKHANDFLISRGVSKEHAAALTKMFKGGLDAGERNYLETGYTMGTHGLAADSGDVPKALGMSEQLSHAVQLPAIRDLRRVSGMYGRIIRGRLGSEEKQAAMADLIAGGTTLWRNTTLIRGAYPLRELIDLSVSAGLGGYASFLTSPIRALSLATTMAAQMHVNTAWGHLLKSGLTGQQSGRVQSLNMALEARLRSGPRMNLEQRTRARLGTAVRKAPYQAVTLGRARVLPTVARAAGINRAAADDMTEVTEGLSQMIPALDQNWARINGNRWFADFNRYMEGEDVEAASLRLHDGLTSIHGNYAQDEKASRLRNSITDIRLQNRDDPAHQANYRNGIIDKLQRMSRDQDFRNIASADVTRETAIARLRGNPRRWADRANMRPELINLADPDSVDNWIDYSADLMNRITVSDPELLEAIATGVYKGEKLTARNRALHNKIQSMIDDETTKAKMPAQLPVEVYSKSNKAPFADAQLANRFFAGVGEWGDLLVRGPLIREAYARRVAELGEDMTPAAKAHAVKVLRDAGDVTLARQVQGIQLKPGGSLGVDEVDAIAEGYVRRTMAETFYDASRRANWQMALRVAFPFAQATYNTFKRWGKMSLQNPQQLYRVTKPIEALMAPGSAVIYDVLGAIPGNEGMQAWYTPEAPEDGVNGFFFTDAFGERKFGYPLVGGLEALLINAISPGSPAESKMFAASGRAASLNVAGVSLNPGMGPMLTLASSFFADSALGRRDDVGEAARWMFPYGVPQGDTIHKVWGSFAPTIFKKMSYMDDQDGYVANTTVKMMPTLLSTGDYDMTVPADQRRLLTDGKRISKGLLFLNAVIGSFTPTTFNAMTNVAAGNPSDPTGASRLYAQQFLADQYQKYQKSTRGQPDGFDKAQRLFIKDFGLTALLAVLPTTTTRDDDGLAGPPATSDVWEFRTLAPQAYADHKAVIGLFFPGDDMESQGARFEPELAKAQRREGTRRYASPTGQLKAWQRTIGWMLYNGQTTQLDDLGVEDEQRTVARAQIKANITRLLPEWYADEGSPERIPKLINKLEDALNDEDIRTLPSAPAMKSYLDARKAALSYLWEQGESGDLSTKAALPVRQALAQFGYQLSMQDTSGGFRNAWNQVFANELGG